MDRLAPAEFISNEYCMVICMQYSSIYWKITECLSPRETAQAYEGPGLAAKRLVFTQQITQLLKALDHGQVDRSEAHLRL
jgi:hypothetical protein